MKVKLTKTAISKFIVWSTTKYNDWLGFGTKKQAVELALKTLLDSKETVEIRCASPAGENPQRGRTKSWRTKQSGALYIVNGYERSITNKSTQQKIEFIYPPPPPMNEELEKNKQFTVNEARNILKDMAISQIGNDRFIRKNIATEKIIFAMVKYAEERVELATTQQAERVKALEERVKQLEDDLKDLYKCGGLSKDEIQGKIVNILNPVML